MLQEGIRGEQYLSVAEENTAKALNSGALRVLATPAMITLMEATAFFSMQPYLEPGCGTVGTALNIRHLAPTPVGKTVRCESTLIKVDGRRLEFSVCVTEQESGKVVGEGTHERCMIDEARFLKKAYGEGDGEKK